MHRKPASSIIAAELEAPIPTTHGTGISGIKAYKQVWIIPYPK